MPRAFICCHWRIHAVSELSEYIDHLEFTWEFGAIGASACRLDLTLDFSLRSPEHILKGTGHDKIISEYVRCFSKRCVALEADTLRSLLPVVVEQEREHLWSSQDTHI